MGVRVLVNSGVYRDSVALMNLQRELRALPGVSDAGVLMATPTNLELLRLAGLWSDELRPCGPGDLVVAVAGPDAAALQAALERADQGLSRVTAAAPARSARVPISLDAALRLDPEANLAVISVPGIHAATEAYRALQRGLHVFLFSDNVPLADEVELKSLADDRDLLCLGPDCGTGWIDGLAVGFANSVRRGPVGIVGASGTGIQELACALDRAGVGVSHALGTGGRDLGAEVRGRATLAALRRLDADPATEMVLIVSKAGDPEVAAQVATACRKPAVHCFLGEGGSLAAAARTAVDLAQRPVPGPCPRGSVLGLYSGGTLAAEAAAILGAWCTEPVARELNAPGHTVVDLGDDRFTAGRLHPMIDYTLRGQLLRQAVRQPGVACVLLDVVLGHGAHPDPAGALAPCLEEARVPVVVALCGTEGDPQGYSRQLRRLTEAGARVEGSNAAAARLAARLARGLDDVERRPLLGRPVRAINVGLDTFAGSLARQGVPVVAVRWRPPAGGDPELARVLRRLA